MTGDSKKSSPIPIRFIDDNGSEIDADYQPELNSEDSEVIDLSDTEGTLDDFSDLADADSKYIPEESGSGAPPLAELVAAQAELKRLKMALAESQEGVARRQADFENYRKRIERDRGEAHNRIVADVARKLLPVVDNLGRALEAERSIENKESKEFRHFLHGIELIDKQLHEVLESLGIQPIVAVGERFDPHIHEAVVTEPSDKYEPDIVTEELARGYRIGDRLLRPSMVKVAARANE